MSNIEWKEEYNLGIEEIDFEHRIFVKIIKKIEQHIIEGYDENYIQRLMFELIKYTSFHFQSEENIMVDIKYPEIINHKKQHEHLVSKLQLILLEIEIGQHQLEDLPVFLIEWFHGHTLGEDMKLAEFINK